MVLIRDPWPTGRRRLGNRFAGQRPTNATGIKLRHKRLGALGPIDRAGRHAALVGLRRERGAGGEC
jgi:hypothetical protein